MKKITFLVPCYNAEAYMHICVESLLKAGPEAEILLVDDGSTDKTGVIADEYAVRYPDIVRVIHQPNGGHGAGVNIGIAHAQGVYFKIVDSDDWLEEKALAVFMDALSDTEPDLYLSNYVYTDGSGRITNRIRYRGFAPAGKTVGWDDTRALKRRQFIMSHGCAFKTELLRQAKVYAPEHTSYDDNVFVHGGLLASRTLKYLDLDLYYYLIGREGQSVQMDVALRKYKQQIAMSKTQFLMADLAKLKAENKKKYRCLYHQTLYMMIVATEFSRIRARRTKDEQARRDWKDMWSECSAAFPEIAGKMKYRSICLFCNVPGRFGEWLCDALYTLVNSVEKLNG